MGYDEELFQEFLANRAEAHGKKINTERSVKGQRKKLDGWHENGYNCNAIIQHAIDVGWRGLYLPQGFQPKKREPLRPPRERQDLISSLVRDTKLPPVVNNEQTKRRAHEAREEILRLTGKL